MADIDIDRQLEDSIDRLSRTALKMKAIVDAARDHLIELDDFVQNATLDDPDDYLRKLTAMMEGRDKLSNAIEDFDNPIPEIDLLDDDQEDDGDTD